MGETIPIAVPRKGRPLESVLDRIADRLGVPDLADDITSTLRHEKALTKGSIEFALLIGVGGLVAWAALRVLLQIRAATTEK